MCYVVRLTERWSSQMTATCASPSSRRASTYPSASSTLAQLPRRRLARNRQHGCGPTLVGEAYIWRPEGSSTARPSRPVPASSWLVAATVIPAEDFTREPRYSYRIYHPAPCGPGFLVHGA